MEIIKFSTVTDEMRKMMIQDLNSLYNKLNIVEDIEKIESLFGKKIGSWVENKNVNGAICIDEHKLVGFLFAELKIGEHKRQAWVPSFGISAFGSDNDKIIYELYKYCSKQWIELGYFEHIIETLDIESQMLSLQMLGFAFQQVHGLLKLSEYKESHSDAEISIRTLEKDDEDNLLQMADVIYRYQNASPVYVPAQPETVKSIRDGFTNLVNDEEVIFYVAENNRPVAFQGLWEEEYGYLIPDKCLELTVAGTFSDFSHKGVNTKLTNFVVKDLISKGYEWLSTDWRITNISSRRFWNKKCGFKVTKNRMIRTIESEISWAKF